MSDSVCLQWILFVLAMIVGERFAQAFNFWKW